MQKLTPDQGIQRDEILGEISRQDSRILVLVSQKFLLSEKNEKTRFDFCPILLKLFLYLKGCAIFLHNLFFLITITYSTAPYSRRIPTLSARNCFILCHTRAASERVKSYNEPWCLLVILKKIQSLRQIVTISHIVLGLFTAQ